MAPSSPRVLVAAVAVLLSPGSLAAKIPPRLPAPAPTPAYTFLPEFLPVTLTITTDLSEPTPVCTAVLSVSAVDEASVFSKRCRFGDDLTSWATVTSSNIPVDCGGCNNLVVEGNSVRCPLGHKAPPYKTTVTDVASTYYGFTCKPTPSLPLPVVPKPTAGAQDVAGGRGGGPPYTPVGLKVVETPGGRPGCVAVLSVRPTATAQLQRECAEAQRPTQYAQTATSTVAVDCGKCGALEVEGERHGCPFHVSPTTTIRDEGTATLWTYACTRT